MFSFVQSKRSVPYSCSNTNKKFQTGHVIYDTILILPLQFGLVVYGSDGYIRDLSLEYGDRDKVRERISGLPQYRYNYPTLFILSIILVGYLVFAYYFSGVLVL